MSEAEAQDIGAGCAGGKIATGDVTGSRRVQSEGALDNSSGEAAVGDPHGEGPRLRGSTIGQRITLALVGVSALTLIAAGFLFYGFLGRYVVERQRDQLLAHAKETAEQVQRLGDFTTLRPMMRMPLVPAGLLSRLLRIDLQVLPSGAGIVVFDGSEVVGEAGLVVTGARGYTLLLEEGRRVTEKGAAGAEILSSRQDDTQLILAAAPLVLDETRQGLVVITLPTSATVGDRWGLLRVLLVSGAIAVGLALATGLGLGSWLARPLRRLAENTRAMAAGSYAEPVSGSYPREVFELAAGLETMRREVHRSEESLRGFVASAAHELRTPLTSIQGFSQALLDGTAVTPEQQQRAAATIYRESGRLRRLVDALLTLSRYDSREFHPHLATADAARLLREEVDRLVEAGQAEPGRIRVMAEPGTDVVTDADMFRQVIANLLHNAVQHGGDDDIEASVEKSDSFVVLTVRNGGAPLSGQERARVFDRFYRGKRAHAGEGFGLGLPLVREICEVLGGRVEVAGEGDQTVFRVSLPVKKA